MIRPIKSLDRDNVLPKNYEVPKEEGCQWSPENLGKRWYNKCNKDHLAIGVEFDMGEMSRTFYKANKDFNDKSPHFQYVNSICEAIASNPNILKLTKIKGD